MSQLLVGEKQIFPPGSKAKVLITTPDGNTHVFHEVKNEKGNWQCRPS